MSTLIEVTKNGRIYRCDAACYDAKRRKCDCICGGKNHRKGLTRALKITDREGKSIINDIRFLEGRNIKGSIIPKPIQFSLF